jgi:hypothetical protein
MTLLDFGFLALVCVLFYAGFLLALSLRDNNR